MKVYLVCEVNIKTREIFRVREIFSNRKAAIERAIVLLQDTGNYYYTEGTRNLLRKLVGVYLDKFGEFYDDFEVAVFERTVDPFS